MKKIFKRLRTAFKVLISKHVIVYTMGNESEDDYFHIDTDDKIFVESGIDILTDIYEHNKKIN